MKDTQVLGFHHNTSTASTQDPTGGHDENLDEPRDHHRSSHITRATVLDVCQHPTTPTAR